MKWIAVSACVIMGGLIVLFGDPNYAAGFATGAVAIGIFG